MSYLDKQEIQILMTTVTEVGHNRATKTKVVRMEVGNRSRNS